MNLGNPNGYQRRRRAVASILATMIMFAMLFSGGVGFLLFINQNSLINNQASAGRQATLQQASLEHLVVGVKLSSVADPWGQMGDLGLTLNNTGGATVTVLDVYVTNVAKGQPVSNSQVTPGSHYLSVLGTGAQMGDLNVTLPLSISMGASTRTMSGCISGKTGCDLAISKTSYPYVSGTTVLVSVLTSTGNIFSAQYPLPGGTPGIGSNALVVKLIAAPPQTLTCSGCVTVTVTVYNYATSPVTGVALDPSPPTAQVTGTASITGGSCLAPVPSNTITAYSGSGSAPFITFTCTYNANTGAVGGFASFSGSAIGTLNSVSVSSAQEVSNTIQIGGTVSVLNQGPFSANSFFFKDTYCYQKGGIIFVSPCTQTPSGTLSIGTLPSANPQNGSADYYVAYYVQVTNNFNTTVPLLQYSYFQTDPSLGGESDFYLVGAASSYSASSCTSGVSCYFPDYSKFTPTLTPYGGDAITCAETPPNYNLPSSTNCIDIAPGQTVTLTFAACRFGTANWNWGFSQYGRAFDNPLGCTPQNPPNYQTPEATYLSIVLSFMYKGQVYDQQIPFQGETVLGGKTNNVTPCNTEVLAYCGTVFYTQYSGAVGYFNFVYKPGTPTPFAIPTPPVVINNNLPHGSDGVVFNPQDHMILTGTNQPYNGFNEVNPNTGVATTYPSTIYSYNLMVDSAGTKLWMDGDPGAGSLAWVPLSAANPSVGAPTTLSLSGDDVNLNTVIFVDPTHVYYTAELGTRFEGMTGHVGSIDTATGVTTCFKDAGGACHTFTGVHGGSYDPFTQDLMVYGWNVINQINPTTGPLGWTLVASETVSALTPSAGNVFDQGAVDGFGHLFLSWASDTGAIYFEDYSSGSVGIGNFHYITPQTLKNNLGATAFFDLDDLAPIVGPGSQG
ncbi:MAG: hypothetical protein OK438_00570 [Thaumarchaeota archaeon]|nr:hypothetical protein [Nitrososphaerota archaeon]